MNVIEYDCRRGYTLSDIIAEEITSLFVILF